jgi:hypothetical protein
MEVPKRLVLVEVSLSFVVCGHALSACSLRSGRELDGLGFV